MLHIDMSIVWVVVNLLLLLVLLRIFLFKPVLGMIEKRKNLIAASLEDADQKNADAAALKAQYEGSVRDARQQSAQIVSEARDRAQGQYDQIIRQAHADAEQILQQANAAAQADRDRMMKDAQGELAEIALAAASKLLGTTVDAATNRDILDAFLAEAGNAE